MDLVRGAAATAAAAFEAEFSRRCRRGEGRGVLCRLALDSYVSLLATEGRRAAEAVMTAFGAAFGGIARPGDIVAVSEGSLLAFLAGTTGEDARAAVSALLAREGAQPDGSHLRIRAGLVAIPRPAADPAYLLRKAEAACDVAGSGARADVVLVGEGVSEAAGDRAAARAVLGLAGAIAEGRLRLWGQQIVDLATPREAAQMIEVTLRMLDETGAEIDSGTLMDAAERHHMAARFDRWTIRAVLCDRAAALAAASGITLSLNLSGQTLSDPSLWDYVDQALQASTVDPRRVQFEITETAGIDDPAAAAHFAERARARGCRIALDDFGVGLSGFGYLLTFHADCIKLDGSLVQGAGDAASVERSIVEAIVAIARRHGMTVVAEHVDSEVLLESLRSIGIRHVQGYILSEPRPIDACLA